MISIEYKVAVVGAEISLSRPFRCDTCGYSATATARFRATGSATVGATRRNAADVAADRAVWIAKTNLNRQWNILRCPSCKHISPAGLGRYRRGRVALAVLLLAVGGAAVWMALTANDIGLSRLGWIFSIVGLCALQPIWQAMRPPCVDVTFADR